MFNILKNKFLYFNKYKTHPEAIVISCFFNPQKSEYRVKAFNHFYKSIKHLNHHIVECVIGNDSPQLEASENISHVHTETLLWHKESLLNKIISELPKKYKYVFWVDADVIFTNLNWLVDAVEVLQKDNIVQPFASCTHLEKDELRPSDYATKGNVKKTWLSFGATYAKFPYLNKSEVYDTHGHVGFAWGARREILDAVPLYDRALIGGADHIIAHACVGQIPHSCITKSFTDDIDAVTEWSEKFYKFTKGKLNFVPGELYHIWHGDIEKRDYYKRIKNFTDKSKKITKKDDNGLYITTDNDVINYMNNYFLLRELTSDESFLHSNTHSHDESCNHDHEFHGLGGESGGAGSSGSWDNDKDNQNFS